MPELPEVETVVRYIRPFTDGRQIKDVFVPKNYTKVIETHSIAQFKKKIIGQKIIGTRRRAKYIVFDLEKGCLAVHLRMTGRLLTKALPKDQKKHLRVTLTFSDGTSLYFKDVRKFGRVYFFENRDALDITHGPEPLSKEFSEDYLKKLLQCRSRVIKPLLLDQKLIAGLGNIYVDESLWAAKIHPLLKSDQIKSSKVKLLYNAIREILKKSITLNGTTFQSFYFGEEASGEFKNELMVFGKQDTPCPRCRCKIKKTKVGQRGTHFCPRCQKEP